jgi:uncharacterized protein
MEQLEYSVRTSMRLETAGIGLRIPHLAAVVRDRPVVPWFEVHIENYLCGGPMRRTLQRISANYPLAFHGVGLSLGAASPLDLDHLARVRALCDEFEPFLVSEHLAWSGIEGVYLNDLLPLPYMEESLAVVAENIDHMQTELGLRVLIENPSAYLRYQDSLIPEAEFLAALVARTGCGLLCDVNNIHVSAHNLGFDPRRYLDALPATAVGEIHLAGHHRNEVDGAPILIDDHGSAVAEPVWDLYAHAIRRVGRVPTLIEWDSRLPALEVLLQEAGRADREAAGAIGSVHVPAV